MNASVKPVMYSKQFIPFISSSLLGMDVSDDRILALQLRYSADPVESGAGRYKARVRIGISMIGRLLSHRTASEFSLSPSLRDGNLKAIKCSYLRAGRPPDTGIESRQGMVAENARRSRTD